jgi:hypothetical protein
MREYSKVDVYLKILSACVAHAPVGDKHKTVKGKSSYPFSKLWCVQNGHLVLPVKGSLCDGGLTVGRFVDSSKQDV